MLFNSCRIIKSSPLFILGGDFMNEYSIRIERPLFFLCGPYFTGKNTDRRKIVLEYINALNSNIDDNYQPIPFIVDPLFSETVIKERNLNLSLVEEIIANISMKTYIFLDTFSTAMEFGLFLNNSSNNQIEAFIPYERFKDIGDFVKLSAQTRGDGVKLTGYNPRYEEVYGKVYYYFQDDKIDDIISVILKDDIEKFRNESYYKRFDLLNIKDFPSKYYQINYQIAKDDLTLYLSIKSLFYILLSLDAISPLSKFTNIEITSSLMDTVKKELLKVLAGIFKNNCSEQKTIIALMNLNPKNIKLFIHNINNLELEKLIFHMLNLIQVIQIHTEKEQEKGARVLALYNRNPISKWYHFRNEINYNDLFRIDESDDTNIKSYLKNPDKYIVKKIIYINRKKRLIISYKNNKYGNKLREIHKKINSTLNLFEQNVNSHAYIQGESIKTATIKHINSKYFIKLDIKDFFGSITKKRLENIIKSINDSNPISCFKNIFNLDLGIEKKIGYFCPKIGHTGLNQILEACFYKGKLPLGYITSPSLSNIYMMPIDNAMDYDNVIYSRYADDILLSCENSYEISKLINAREKVSKNIKKIGLEMNLSKSKFKAFKYIGDHIKFLGINIVNDDPNNRLTVSLGFILKTLKMEAHSSKKYKSKILGRRSFIKFISSDSYDKYLKIRKIKLRSSQ